MSTEAIFQNVDTLSAFAPTPTLSELVKRAEALQPLLRKNTVASEKTAAPLMKTLRPFVRLGCSG